MTAEIVDISPNKRKLVTIRTVGALDPIPGADAIEVATVEGWQVVVKKNEVKVGDKVVYFEIDSFLPTGNPAWQFLVDKSGRTFEGVVGHRLRTVKLRGQVSQGFIIPLDAVPTVVDYIFSLPEETDLRSLDLSELLGIKKWEQPLPAELAGQAEGLFPSWMRKTDQERCQNLIAEIFQTEDQLVEFDISSLTPEALTTMQYKGLLEWVGAMGKGGKWMKVVKAKADADARYEVTLKCDGSSMTVFARGTVVKEDQDQVLVQMDSGVCSRNLQLKVNAENADNTFVAVALKSGLLGLLEQLARDGEGSFAVQGELMGPGIQGNRENLKVHQLFVFDVQNLDNGTYLTPAERHEFMLKLHTNGVSPDLVKHVPILYPAATLQELGLFNVKDLLAFAEGPSISHQVREGLVFKRIDGQFSFKAISNLFLTKEKD
jgi:hypothetical protein